MPDVQHLRPSAEGEALVSGYYVVSYAYPGSVFEAVTTHLGAYSEEDAADRVRGSIVGHEVTILRVALLGDPEPVTCTYEGGEGAVYPEGPWVFMDWLDKWAPLLVCDVHGHPAHGCVYESSDPTQPGPEHYTGPCQYHPDPTYALPSGAGGTHA